MSVFFWRNSNLGLQNGMEFSAFFFFSPQFVFAQKNIGLRKYLFPVPQKGLLAKHAIPYCPSCRGVSSAMRSGNCPLRSVSGL